MAQDVGATLPRTGDDPRLQQVHQRIQDVTDSLKELEARRSAVVASGTPARSREAAQKHVQELFGQLAAAHEELEGLRLAMRNRGVIEQAKGMLMLRFELDEEAAFGYLRTLSNTANRKLVDVARDVVRTRAGETTGA